MIKMKIKLKDQKVRFNHQMFCNEVPSIEQMKFSIKEHYRGLEKENIVIEDIHIYYAGPYYELNLKCYFLIDIKEEE